MDRRNNYIDPINRDLREGIDTLPGSPVLKEFRALMSSFNLQGVDNPQLWKRAMAGVDGVTLTVASLGIHSGELIVPMVLIGANVFLKFGLSAVVREARGQNG